MSEEEKNYYYTIRHIMDIRDVIFHGEYTGKSIEKRIEAKGKSINIYLKQLECKEEKLIKIFSRYLINSQLKDKITVRGNLNKGYAYVTIPNLKSEYIDINNVVTDLKNNLNTLYHQLGKNVLINSDNRQPENYLNIFFQAQDYLLVKNTLEWFLNKLDQHL